MAWICLIVLSLSVILCDGGFAPSQKEEAAFTSCLLNGSGRRCRQVKSMLRTVRKRQKEHCSKKGSIIDAAEANLADANSYICALTDYQNSGKTVAEVERAILDMGSCSSLFKSVRHTWKSFLDKRKYEMQILPAEPQRKNSTRTAVQFFVGEFIRRYSREEIHGIDLIISRSAKTDVETYGRYNITITFTPNSDADDNVIVHDTVQSTCPSSEKRSFVAALNDHGRNTVYDWLMQKNDVIDFDVKILPQNQIVRDGLQRSGNYRESRFDIGEHVSAIVFHLESKINYLPVQTGIFDPSSRTELTQPIIPRRHKRSPTLDRENCHRESYFINYRSNPVVISPPEFDLGECVGSCEQVFTVDINATNHALSMQSEGRYKHRDPRNPTPTVCCIPISFKRFHYIRADERGSLMSSYVDNMVSEYCGCR